MKHWAAIDRETGEVRFVISEAGKKPSDHGECPKRNRFVPLHRAPEEHDLFDGKKLVRCDHTRARLDREGLLNSMSRVEFLEYVLAQVDARLAGNTTPSA